MRDFIISILQLETHEWIQLSYHKHTHTHIHAYMYVCFVCIYVCVFVCLGGYVRTNMLKRYNEI